MTFGGLVIYLFNLGVAMGAILAFVAITYSGMKLLGASGNPYSISNAKKKIFNALLGLAVLLVSYILLTTINPDLVNIKDISLGGIQINVPILSSNKPEDGIPTLSFQEAPIGTVTEGILAGNSSTRNGLECFEYDDETGDVIDKNGDGKITEKDIVLDRDIFYCMKDLEEALRKKTEVQIPKLIKELNALMESCTCDRVFVAYQPPAKLYSLGGECGCTGCTSYCKTCGHPHTGCPNAPGNELEGESELEQYTYDPCPNRKEIDCKRQEIKQLMDGTDPEDICYDKEWIKEDAPKYPNMLTFSDGIKRMTAFQNYFINEVNTLKQVEKSTKSPFGERLTLAEFNTAQNGNKDNVIVKSEFGNYNIFRYCDEYKYSCESGKVENSDEDGECNNYILNDQYRTCKKFSYEKFYYDGDPVTFYFNSTYNERQKENLKTTTEKSNYECSVYGKDDTGVIPIGEAVDGTERYGLEVAKRIGDLIENIQGVYTTTLSISNIPETCDSGNCVNANTNCCSRPQCNCKGKCCCPSVTYRSCYNAIPGASLYSNFSNYSAGFPLTKSYTGCSDFCGILPTTRQEESQKWTCSYASFCGLVRKIYRTEDMDSSCYDKTDNTEETALRERNMNMVGYLQKWKEREERLYELTEIKSLKKVEDIDVDAANDVINNVCASYLINPDEKTLECDSDLSTIDKVDSRFSLVEKLVTSRKKMNSCVTGYSYPYKENLAQSFVFNCLEGIEQQTVDNLVILPDFPYPSAKALKYQNCYPYNDAGLSKEDQTKCFNNIYIPTCQALVEEYMDNYYCCK